MITEENEVERIIAYTDGSCAHQNQNGGYGIYITYKSQEVKYYKGFSNTKIGRMELLGVLACLKLIKNKNIPLTIYCDSQYVVNTINTWLFKWIGENYAGKKNVDILKELAIEKAKFTDFEMRWVKGHANNEGNEIADRLANKGYKSEIKILDTYNLQDFINNL